MRREPRGHINDLVEAARHVPEDEREAWVRAATTDEQLRADVLMLLSEDQGDPWFVDEPSAPPPAPPVKPGPRSEEAPAISTPAPEGTRAREATPAPGGTPAPEATPSPQTILKAFAPGPTSRPPATSMPPTTPMSPSRPAPPTASIPRPTPVHSGTPMPPATPMSPSSPAPPAASIPRPTPVHAATSMPPATPVSPSSPAPPAASTPRPTPVHAASSIPRPTPPPQGRFAEAGDRSGEPAAGGFFGAYRIVSLTGRGGMGAVYEALYQGDGFQQRVTLRVLPRDWNTAAAADWFRAACHLVAGLDHPWIARLVDGGVTDDGTPYVATEHVTGKAIDEWCREQRLDVPGRIRLVLRVCTALEFAHQRLVVHRSVSPNNILVTADGHPKVLNTGVARLLFGRPDAGEGLSRTGQSLFTPEYASPEQVRGELMTAASDIYSLGALLYALLTERPPCELRDLSPQQMKQAICEQEPGLPSHVVPDPQRRVLEYELDAIVMKALRKDPRTRYLSVTALAADLHAWLDARPVSVFPGTPWHRAGRLISRHKFRAAAAAAAGLLVVGGASVVGWQAWVMRLESGQAEARSREARRFSQSLLFELNDSLRGLPGSAAARTLMLARAVEFMNSLAKRPGSGNLDVELAEGYRGLARLQAGAPGEESGGPAAAVKSLDAAVAFGERALAADPRSVDAVIASIGATGDLAAARLGTGEPAAADRAHARHRSLVEQLARQRPRDVRARTALASGYSRLAEYRGARSEDWAAAKSLYGSAVTGFESLAAEGELTDDVRRDYSRAEQQLGAILLRDGAIEEAERLYLSAQALDKEDVARHPQDGAGRLDLAASTGGLARVAKTRGDNARAESLWTQALTTAQAALDTDAKNGRGLERVAELRESLGSLCESQRRFGESLAHYQEALRARERVAGQGAPPGAALALAIARLNVARVLLDRVEARPPGPNENGRLPEVRALLAQVQPVVHRAGVSSPAQQAARAEADRQAARLRRLAGARQ